MEKCLFTFFIFRTQLQKQREQFVLTGSHCTQYCSFDSSFSLLLTWLRQAAKQQLIPRLHNSQRYSLTEESFVRRVNNGLNLWKMVLSMSRNVEPEQMLDCVAFKKPCLNSQIIFALIWTALHLRIERMKNYLTGNDWQEPYIQTIWMSDVGYTAKYAVPLSALCFSFQNVSFEQVQDHCLISWGGQRIHHATTIWRSSTTTTTKPRAPRIPRIPPPPSPTITRNFCCRNAYWCRKCHTGWCIPSKRPSPPARGVPSNGPSPIATRGFASSGSGAAASRLWFGHPWWLGGPWLTTRSTTRPSTATINDSITRGVLGASCVACFDLEKKITSSPRVVWW